MCVPGRRGQASGRWQQLYRGVYASFTGDPPRECLPWAAVLRGGEGAAISHQTAAELDRLTDKPSEVIHVTIGHDRQVRSCGQWQHELAMSRRPRWRWRAEILGALGTIAEGVHSNLEYRYVRDVERAHGLPTARRQARTTRGSRAQYFDNLYEEHGVAVELDGRAAHPCRGPLARYPPRQP